MNSRAPGTKLVIFMIATALVTAMLATVVGNIRFASTTTYHALFDNASGLKQGEDVKIAGVPVGKIESVSLSPQHQALVSFTVDRDQSLMAGTLAAVRYKNLIGDRFLELTSGPGPLQELPAGGTIPASQTRPALDLDRLLNGLKPLLQGLDPDQTNQLATSLIKVLGGESGNIDALVQQIASLTNSLADRDAVIGRVIDNLNTVLGTLDDNGAQLGDLVTRLQSLVSGLNSDRGPILDSLAGINSVADTAAGVIRDARAPLAADVGQLGRLADNLNQSQDLINMVLGKLPGMYQLIGRGAYGDFFNFYLCGVAVRVSGPTGPITIPEVDSPVQRCQFPK